MTYEKDKNSLRVTIRYAHDPKRQTRTHVIMMSKDQKRFAQYDEIEMEDGTVVRTNCVSSAPQVKPDGFSDSKNRNEAAPDGTSVDDSTTGDETRDPPAGE